MTTNETFSIEAGAGLRRHVRVQLDLMGLPYREHKGWFESTFVVTGPKAAVNQLCAWIDHVKEARQR